eukprot:365252-Chlamydomonas_euryale.AAC.39
MLACTTQAQNNKLTAHLQHARVFLMVVDHVNELCDGVICLQFSAANGNLVCVLQQQHEAATDRM